MAVSKEESGASHFPDSTRQSPLSHHLGCTTLCQVFTVLGTGVVVPSRSPTTSRHSQCNVECWGVLASSPRGRKKGREPRAEGGKQTDGPAAEEHACWGN